MKLMAIDGNSLVNRAFYGVKALTSAAGTPTNALYGFLNMLFKLQEVYRPDAVCVCFDRREKTFRHQMYEGYKAQRKPMPEELAAQLPLVKEVLALMGITCLERPGFEADDLLGTLARLCSAGGDECVIATGDRDSLQFISQGATVSLVITKMGQTLTEDFDSLRFAEKYGGLTPDKIVDLKAIMGDSSDNIPGVKGIGEKGAMDLLTRFGSLDGVYKNIDDPSISPSTRKKLEEGRDMAYLSYRLALGNVEVPIDLTLGDLEQGEVQEGELHEFLSRYQLKSIIAKLGLKPGESTPDTAGPVFSHAEYVQIKTAGELAALENKIRAEGSCTLLVDNELLLCAVCCGGQTAVFHAADTGERAFENFLKGICTSSAVKTCLHDAKPVYRRLLQLGAHPALPAFDTALAAYLLNPTGSDYALEQVASAHLGADIGPDIYNGEDAQNLFGVTQEALSSASRHCQAVHALWPALEARLEETNMVDLLRDIELPLMGVLAHMEHLGMAVDKRGLLAFGESISGDMARLEKEIHALAGEQFNIGSPKQLGVILFEKMGLKATKKTKTGYSTDADVLEKLKHHSPIVQAILEWRKLSKLQSTYVEGLSKVIGADGRIHSTFHQMVTATGRLSSSDPNLQNIPIRQKLGSEIRRCFLASPGMVLIDADYSQIELRILAHIAGDKVMLDAFKNGEDIHTVTASQVFGVDPNEVTPQMRSSAKAVNFGIVYGISAFSLSDDIGVTPKEAQRYIDAYFEKYPGVRRYMDTVRQQAKEDGFVTTLYGRRRYLPELKSANHNIRSFGERVALNTPIQGTAADIIKIAMINICRRLEREGLEGKLILQVHDELIIEAPCGEKDKICALLKEEMEHAADLSVALTADVSYGENWYAAKG